MLGLDTFNLPSSSLDARTAQALGLQTTTGFTAPPLGTTPATDSKIMLWIGVAGLVVAVATYFKGR